MKFIKIRTKELKKIEHQMNNFDAFMRFIVAYNIDSYCPDAIKDGPEWYLARVLRYGARTKRYLSEFWDPSKDCSVYQFFKNVKAFKNKNDKICFICFSDNNVDAINTSFEVFVEMLPPDMRFIGLNEMHNKFKFNACEHQLIMFWDGREE